MEVWQRLPAGSGMHVCQAASRVACWLAAGSRQTLHRQEKLKVPRSLPMLAATASFQACPAQDSQPGRPLTPLLNAAVQSC